MRKSSSGGPDLLLEGNVLGELEGTILRDLFCGIIWGFPVEKLELWWH